MDSRGTWYSTMILKCVLLRYFGWIFFSTPPKQGPMEMFTGVNTILFSGPQNRPWKQTVWLFAFLRHVWTPQQCWASDKLAKCLQLDGEKMDSHDPWYWTMILNHVSLPYFGWKFCLALRPSWGQLKSWQGWIKFCLVGPEIVFWSLKANCLAFCISAACLDSPVVLGKW